MHCNNRIIRMMVKWALSCETHLAVRTCLSVSPTMSATVASVLKTVLKEAVDGRTGELQGCKGIWSYRDMSAQHGQARHTPIGPLHVWHV
jgi:hypothetical protein